jgi:hypothetical protein
MTTSQQPGWYDDPNDSKAQRYWDGNAWTPHRQRKPVSQATTPPPPLPPSLPTQPAPPVVHSQLPPPVLPPPPANQQGPSSSPDGGSPRKSLSPNMIAVGAVVVLAVAGMLVYFVWPHISSHDGQSSASAPNAQGGGSQGRQYPPNTGRQSPPNQGALPKNVKDWSPQDYYTDGYQTASKLVEGGAATGSIKGVTGPGGIMGGMVQFVGYDPQCSMSLMALGLTQDDPNGARWQQGCVDGFTKLLGPAPPPDTAKPWGP